MKKILLFTLILISAIGCSGKRSQTNFNITGSAIVTGAALDGGVYLRAVSSSGESVPLDYELFDEHSAVLPFGDWSLHFVGYSGPGQWSGTTYCGSVLDVTLAVEETTLNVNLDQTNCSVEPYLTIIADVDAMGVSLWDFAEWDSSTWGP